MFGLVALRPSVLGAGGGVGELFIFDTDFSTDADDAPALALMCAGIRQNGGRLLAVTTSSAHDYSAPAVRACLNYELLQSVPVGAYQGANVNASFPTNTSAYAQRMTNGFGVNGDTRANYSSALSVLRQALVSASKPVRMVCVGPCTNMSALLNSAADGISPLTGAQLVSAKVSALYIMGGVYPGPSGEFNFQADSAAANNVFANWPTPIFACGTDSVGQLTCTQTPGCDPGSNPYAFAYDASGITSRTAYDPATVLFALGAAGYGGYASLFTLGGTNGTIGVNAGNGVSQWSATTGTRNYVSLNASVATINAALDALFAVANPNIAGMTTHSIDFTTQTYSRIQDRTLALTPCLVSDLMSFSAGTQTIDSNGLFVNANTVTPLGTLNLMASVLSGTLLTETNNATYSGGAAFQRVWGNSGANKTLIGMEGTNNRVGLYTGTDAISRDYAAGTWLNQKRQAATFDGTTIKLAATGAAILSTAKPWSRFQQSVIGSGTGGHFFTGYIRKMERRAGLASDAAMNAWVNG